MELTDVIRMRKMTRSFSTEPVDMTIVHSMLADALRAPSAGFAQGCHLVLLEGPAETATFWNATTTQEWRRSKGRGASLHGRLLDAPVVVVCLTDPEAYLDRYSEPDKSASGLGRDAGTGAWPVPYWIVDASFAAMTILLRCAEEGLGALFFGIFRGEAQLKHDLGIPEHVVSIGAIAIGHPHPEDRPSRSLSRGRRPLDQVVHRGRW